MSKCILKRIPILLVVITMSLTTAGCVGRKNQTDVDNTEENQMNYNYTIKQEQLDVLIGETFTENEQAILKALDITGVTTPDELDVMQECKVANMEAMWNYMEDKYGEEFSPVAFAPANFDETYDRGYFGSNTENADTLVIATMTSIEDGYGFDDDYPAIYCKEEYIKEVSEYLNENYGEENYKIDVEMDCLSSNEVTGKEKPEELIKKGIVDGAMGIILDENVFSKDEFKKQIRQYGQWLYDKKFTTNVVEYYAPHEEFQKITKNTMDDYLSTTMDTGYECSISQKPGEIDVFEHTREYDAHKK